MDGNFRAPVELMCGIWALGHWALMLLTRWLMLRVAEMLISRAFPYFWPFALFCLIFIKYGKWLNNYFIFSLIILYFSRWTWTKNSIFFAAAPIGTAGEYFRSHSNKFRQKINQNHYLICQKYQSFRAWRSIFLQKW